MATAPHINIRPIHNNTDLESAIMQAMSLSEKAESTPLTNTEQDELEVLTALIEHYEYTHGLRLEDMRKPIERLESLLAEARMNADDLGNLLGQQELGADILSGKKRLNKYHASLLAKHFHVSASFFLE
jgi:antitoxin component HigA of HigAB toxin-antitoxin module